MITRENGNIVLTNATGRHVYGIFDAQYGILSAILARRTILNDINDKAVANYNGLIANLQGSVDNGKPQVQPTKPLMQVISDDGIESEVPFDPPLNDLKPPPATRPAPSGGSGVAQIPVGTGGLTADEQRAMYNMCLAMYHKMFG